MKPVVLTASRVRRMIPLRPQDSNKGKNGHVLLVAGSPGMAGAAILSSLGALKAGTGLLTLAIPEAIRKAVSSRLPEALAITPGEISAYVRRRTLDVLAVGPGLTVSPSIRKRVLKLLGLGLPKVVDADGLNNLRLSDLKDSQAIITPHPGEMARLLGVKVARVQADRKSVCWDTARKYGLICVLKGDRTVVSDGRGVWINPTGNPAMATGGMGDVLTGVIASLVGQGLSRLDAALAGVYLHGLAGDLARVSDRGLLASELATQIPYGLKKIGVR